MRVGDTDTSKKPDKPLILITNDDGIHSPGLAALAEALIDLGELLICAPQTQQTGMSRAFPGEAGTGAMETVALRVGERQITGYGIKGSPAFAVAHGILELAERKPDICVSGINYGENVGLSLTCSGTVGAVMEAFTHGVPGIAVSLETDIQAQRREDYPFAEWSYARHIANKWTARVLNESVPEGVSMLNINVPRSASGEERITRMSCQNYFEFIKPEKRSLCEAFDLRSRLFVDRFTLEKNSDIYAIHVDHAVSITPLTWDFSVNAEFDF